MARLIIITGGLACGKTTVARYIAKKLSINCAIKDDYKEALADEKGFVTREENRLLSIEAVNQMIEVATRYLKGGENYIVEANFREDELQRLFDLAINHGDEPELYCMECDPEQAYERFLARIPTRHRAHLSMGLDKDFDKFKQYNLMLFRQADKFICTYVDTTFLTEEQECDVMLKFILNREKDYAFC